MQIIRFILLELVGVCVCVEIETVLCKSFTEICIYDIHVLVSLEIYSLSLNLK